MDINHAVFTGRIGNDLELRATAAGISVCAIRLAVERQKPKDAEKAETDWIDLVAWRQQAEFAAKFLGKGRKICVDCSVRTRAWDDKDGNKHKAVEFYVNQIVPADSKPQDQQSQKKFTTPYSQPVETEDYVEISLGDDSGVPF